MTEIFNTGLALFFLVTLILIHYLRKKVDAHELSAYNRMANGAVVLAAMSVANLFVGSGMLDTIPVIGDRAVAGFILWVAAMVGTVMLVSGVSHWLPVSRLQKEALQRRTERMEVVNKMSRFLATDSRTDAVLSAAVRFIEQHLPYSRIAAFTISQRTGETRLVASYSSTGTELNTDDLKFSSAALDNLVSADSTDPSALLVSPPDTVRHPDAVVPLHVANRAVGFFLLWDEAISRDAVAAAATVQQVGRLISNHITSQRLTIETDYRRRREQLQTAMMTAIDPTRSLSENFVSLARIILQREPVSLVSLTLPQHWPGHQRMTVSSNDAILQEKNICPDLTDDTLQALFEDGRPLTIRASNSGQPDWITPFIAGENPGCAMLLPIVVREQVQAVVTVAVDTSSGMTTARRSILSAAAHPVATVLQSEHFRLQTTLQTDRLAKVTSFLRRLTAASGGNLFQRAAVMLAENLECSMVRIATFDDDGQFLTSQALTVKHDTDSITPANGAMILSLMPLHRMVRETGRTQQVNQLIAEQRMEESEARQALTATLGSAVLVPIVRHNQAVGVISIAEQREHTRSHLSAADITFAEAIAACLAGAVAKPTAASTDVTDSNSDSSLSYLTVLRQIESGELAVRRTERPAVIDHAGLMEQ